ncbi:MAG: phycocyanobilin:ferredoxin oxidoreductase [Cyanobacteria bacterium P01_D01_bin.71]
MSMQPSLRSLQNPLIRELANGIESIWKHGLTLQPYVIPQDLGYIEGALEGERVLIENCCYRTSQFRKLHMELAQIGNGLDILHCVMFPDPSYNLPIFGTDLVGRRGGGISAAIVDLSPVSSDRSLPEPYQQALGQLPRLEFTQPRDLPDWGDIFSDYCLFVRPTNATEEEVFLQRVLDFLKLHCQIASTAQPLNSAKEILGVVVGQRNYCTKQQQNDKTRRILEKSFGTEWTERYMTTMLFDMDTELEASDIVRTQ